LPTEPLKIDLMRWEVVRIGAEADSVLVLSIRGNLDIVIILVRRAGAGWIIAEAVPVAARPALWAL
jgi:hypothetical protein